MKIKEIHCKQAIGRCGFPGGGLAINPYVGCGHNCLYCYARFIKRFTGHTEKWGSFVDVKTNIIDVLKKQLKSSKYKGQRIFIGTVTDPYQVVEKKYNFTREILDLLACYKNPVSILTKSDLVLRDIDLLKKMKDVDVNFTVNTLDNRWRELIEPDSSSIKQRFKAINKLTKEKISVLAMMGPYFPIFTDPEALFKEFKKVGVKHIFTESLNTTGGNWVGVEKVLKDNYPNLLTRMQKIFFNKKEFYDFYNQAQSEIKKLSKKYKIPTTIYFGLGHVAKFK